MVLSAARALVKKLYYDPKHGFNPAKIYKETRDTPYKRQITHKAIREWINSQQLAGRFKREKPKAKRHFIVKKKGFWECDTMFLNEKAKPFPATIIHKLSLRPLPFV